MGNKIDIPGTLHSTATENVVVETDEVFDSNKGKKQNQLNTEMQENITEIQGSISAEVERAAGAEAGLSNRLEAVEQLAEISVEGGTLELATSSSDITSGSGKVPTANAVNEVLQEVGYFECSTDADVAAKTIAATGYSLRVGGNIRIKMTNANTADAVTLNINGTGAKALFYNGVQASSTNSWEAGEVVEVYYDGEKYNSLNLQYKLPVKQTKDNIDELEFTDEQLHSIVKFSKGHIKTKHFDSSSLPDTEEDKQKPSLLSVEDQNNRSILFLKSWIKVDKDGNIHTKNFKSKANKFLVVDASGNGDYTTIEDAINNAGDDEETTVTIYIKPGVYTPPPSFPDNSPYDINNRNLHIIGENKKTCILRGDVGYYYWQDSVDYSILRLNGNVTIENITIESLSSRYDEVVEEQGYDSGEHQRAYCIHKDGQSSVGDVFTIKNCILINDHFSCVGFGLRPNQNFIIEDCIMRSEEGEKSGFSSYGTVYGHLNSGHKGLNQNFTLLNCAIENKTGVYALLITDSKAADATPQDTFANYFVAGNLLKTTTPSSAITIGTESGFYKLEEICNNKF